MDEQGLGAALLFPTLGCGVEEAPADDIEATMAALSAFNRWLEEDWGFDYQDRIFAAPMLSLADPDAGGGRSRLAHRARRPHGARPARAGARSPRDRPLPRPQGPRPGVGPAGRGGGPCGLPPRRQRLQPDHGPAWGGGATFEASGTWTSSSRVLVADRAIHDTMASLIVHGVFNRHPTLRVASIENGSDWVALLVKRLRKQAEPDAVGLRRGSARHHPPSRLDHAVPRGGPRAPWRSSSASSTSSSARTGPTARAWRNPSTSPRS